jgi:signal transduction histidine kinase/ActR/RegA family two-component response regulator
MWLTVAAGSVVATYSFLHLSVQNFTIRFFLLAFVTLVVSLRITVPIPSISRKGTSQGAFVFLGIQITASDAFIFLTVLLCGGELGILLAAMEGACSSFLYAKTKLTILFNAAVMAVSTFLTVTALQAIFGMELHDLLIGSVSTRFILAIGVMAMVQYLANSTLAAARNALKTNQDFWKTWADNFLWTGATFLASASAAGIVAKMVITVGTPALLLTVPIVAVIYLTVRTYRQNIETSVEKASEAERHVEELNNYILEQERIREQFSQLEKLSALGELASGVAHNFNNTLAGILGRAQLLLRMEGLPNEARNGLRLITRAAEDGAKTVKRIQDFARQRRDKDFELLAVDQLLWEVGEITRPRWKDQAQAGNIHINLVLDIDSKARIYGDPGELREVLVNMVFNAVDAMPDGGRLTLAAREAADWVELSVSDTGSGMSDEVRSRVFDPFFTTKAKAGMGLGLAVSFSIVRRHEGTVTVESKLGAGTQFIIRLPIASEPVSGPLDLTKASIPQAAILNRAGVARILVVEDEDYVRDLMQEILESAGNEIVVAGSGVDALSLLEHNEFDAVFTDVGLPGMSGWELSRRIRELYGDIPIAIVTGWGDAVGSDELKEQNINWVVTKPFTVERLTLLANEVVRFRDESIDGNVTLIEHDATNSDVLN